MGLNLRTVTKIQWLNIWGRARYFSEVSRKFFLAWVVGNSYSGNSLSQKPSRAIQGKRNDSSDKPGKLKDCVTETSQQCFQCFSERFTSFFFESSKMKGIFHYALPVVEAAQRRQFLFYGYSSILSTASLTPRKNDIGVRDSSLNPERKWKSFGMSKTPP